MNHKTISFFTTIKKIRRSIGDLLKISDLLKNEENIVINDLERKIVINRLKENILKSNEMGVTNNKYCGHDVIVSLTSYKKRIYDVCLTIESLMEQTVKPNKIILWLADDELKRSELPQSLLILTHRGLSIEFCEDIKSYKKLIPALKKYPDDIIITVDDDAIYQYDLIENLLTSYKEHPGLIHFCSGHRIKKDEAGNLLDYSNWNCSIRDSEIDKLNFPVGAGGILYPPHCLYSDVMDKDVFMTLCLTGDDIWFKAMALLKGTLSKRAYTHNAVDYIEIAYEAQRETALYNVNRYKNDEQIKAVFSKYNIYELLK